jgi:hypothetical protein
METVLLKALASLDDVLLTEMVLSSENQQGS